MKELICIVLLFMFQVNVVYSWNVRIVNNRNTISQKPKYFLFSALKEECEFKEYFLIDVIIDGETLKNQLFYSKSNGFWHQILLLEEVYNIEENVLVRQSIKICSLRHWLSRILTDLTSVMSVDLIDHSHNNNQYTFSLPFSLCNNNRVKDVFNGDDPLYPALYVLLQVQFNNFWIYHYRASQAYALYRANCKSRTPYFVPEIVPDDEIQVYNCGKNIRHHVDAEIPSVTSALFYKINAVIIENGTITNYDNNEQSIFWDGIAQTITSLYTKIITIKLYFGNESITGLYLTDYSNPNHKYNISSLLYLKNIIFKQGVATGFYFADIEFRLSEFYDNNQFESDGAHCYGKFEGVLAFIDSTACTNNLIAAEEVIVKTVTTALVYSETKYPKKELFTGTDLLSNLESIGVNESGCRC